MELESMELESKELASTELASTELASSELELASKRELESTLELLCKLVCRLGLCTLACMAGVLAMDRLELEMGKLATAMDKPELGTVILVGKPEQMGVLLFEQRRRNRIRRRSSRRYVWCHQVLRGCIGPKKRLKLFFIRFSSG